jgi:4-alpha-glucanotransferase
MALQTWAVARSDQTNLQEAAYADGRVRDLDDDQTERYARLMALILQRLEAHGRPRNAVACEVLSTWPYPIRRVFDRFGLGRFRVTSKLKLDDPADVYRLEHAVPEDWSMLGTHDTATIWQYANDWFQSGDAAHWGHYLASFLAAAPDREQTAARISRSPDELVHALFAAMLAGRARQVSVFFPDVFGMTERYNQPGTVSEDNWRLRLPADFEQRYAVCCQAGTALNVGRCLAMALSAANQASPR